MHTRAFLSGEGEREPRAESESRLAERRREEKETSEFPLSEETLIGMFMAGAGIDPDSVKNVRRDWLPPGYY